MNETYTTVAGNIVGAITKRTLADGTAVAGFRIASNERRWNKTSGSWGDGDRLFMAVTCWRRLAENVAASFVAGDPVVVHGRLYTREYTKDGTRNWVVELEALTVGPDLSRCSVAINRPPRIDSPPDEEGERAGPGEGASHVPARIEAGVGA
ncbi:MAG: single-stranded DNA-binding protein [Pseudonocardia sp.]